MPIQDQRALVMEALSVLDDAPPHPKQFILPDGIHLRWAPGEDRAFPLKGGYFLFRRVYRPTGSTRCLMAQLSDVDVKLIESKSTVVTLVGTLSNVSGQSLKGAQPPQSHTVVGWGFRLLQGEPLRFDLPAGLTAGNVTVSLLFLPIPSGLNQLIRAEFMLADVTPPRNPIATPILKEGASFQPFDVKGGREPSGTIQKGVEFPNAAALICNSKVEVTLPGPCKLVRATVGKGGVTVESFEQDGTLAQRKLITADTFGLTDISGKRVTRVVFTGKGVRIYGVQYEYTEPHSSVTLVGSLRGAQVFTRSVTGTAQDRPTITVDSTNVDSLLLSGGPAAVLDICYIARLIGPSEPSPVDRVSAIPDLPATNWEMIPNLSAPLTLPIIHPSYAASAGEESIQAATAIAKPRLRYGTWQDSFQSSPRQTGTGTLTLTNGSPIVAGSGTNWTDELAGQIICLPKPQTDYVTYTVMAVLAPERLVLSRPYSGVTQTNVPYQVMEGDHFAEMHDQIACLFSRPDNMRAAVAPPLLDEGTVANGKLVLARPGSQTVSGLGTQWTQSLKGAYIEIGPKWYPGFYVEERSVFRIENADAGSQQVTLDRPFPGQLTILSFQVKADFRIFMRPGADTSDSGTPGLEFKPMDLIEMASLIPSYAQVLGLYWIDSATQRGGKYDYIVLADHENRFSRNATTALLWLNGNPDFSGNDVDAFMVLGVKHFGSLPLPPPSEMAVHRLPGGGARLSISQPNLSDSDVGISVLEAASWRTRSDSPVMLNLWRLFRGTEAKNLIPPGDLTKYEDLDKLLPTARTPNPARPPQLPPGWPKDPIHFIDSLLDVGWYSYRANTIDRWGRWSLPSAPIPWVGEHDPAAPQIVDAVHLADRTAPPPPTGVFAWALDPEDPYLFKDAAYHDWKNQWAQTSLTEPVALRVQWRWPWSHRNQGADLREFRIYYQSKPLNARTGRSISVVSSDSTHSVVTLVMDTLDTQPNAYANASLQIGERSFPIVASASGATLQLTVVNGGPSKSEMPIANATATIVIPEGHSLEKKLLDPQNWEAWLTAVPENTRVRHEVEMLEDPGIKTFDHSLNTFIGSAAIWNGAALLLDQIPAGNALAQVRPGIDVISLLSLEPPAYHVLDIKSINATALQVVPIQSQDLVVGRFYQWRLGPATAGLQGIAGTWKSATRQFALDGNPDVTGVRPGVDLVYIPTGLNPTPSNLSLFFSIEAVDAVARVLTLGPDTNLPAQPSFSWQIGQPVRTYDVFLPSGPSAPKGEVARLLKAWGVGPTLSEPVAYGSVAVTSADWRDEIDDWMPTRGRKGNESQLSAPAVVFRVYRTPPPEPEPYDWDVTHLNATPADYRAESFFTVRWKKPAVQGERYSAHICRAMDDSLFASHWELRATLSTPPAQMPKPDRKALAGLLNNIAATSDYASALIWYRQFEDAALSWLAGLDELEDAYMQITIEPLSLADPANQDRLGPDDDPTTYAGPDPSVCANVVALDGKSSNRYFFRVVLLDPAQNRGKMGRPTPPVYLPKVVPPRVPVITKVLGGDRQITIKWASNREPDLAGYRVYRTDDEEKARDVRMMELAATITQADTDLSSPIVEWIDKINVIGGHKYFYRLSAFDEVGNQSEPTRVQVGIAVDRRVPSPPVWTEQAWLLHRQSDDSFISWPTDGIVPLGYKPVIRLGWQCQTPEPEFVIRRWSEEDQIWAASNNFAIQANSIREFAFILLDYDVNPTQPAAYRLRVRSSSGVWSVEDAVLAVSPPGLENQ